MFFVIAHHIKDVGSFKLTNLKNVNFLKNEDILFGNFNKFFINKFVSILSITYLREVDRTKFETSNKKFKNVRINLGIRSFQNLDRNFLLHLAFI